MRFPRFIFSQLFPLVLLSTVSANGAEPGAPPSFTADQVDFYRSTVQPILAENCYKCHGGGNSDKDGKVKVKSGFQIISRAAILKGGDHGSAVNLQKWDQSLLLKAVTYADDHLKMPPSGKLSEDEISALEKWVEMGLPVTPEDANRFAPAAEDHGAATKGPDVQWTYEPMTQPQPPKLANQPQNPIDAFLLKDLTAKGLGFASPASRESLIRRATYDLTGLPPTPEEVSAFVADSAADAWPRLLDRLLASPHYGEKYGRHWLDLVRYAETNGFERDGFKQHIWKYRQWVIDSLNEDKSYDQFVREQIAGDELDDRDSESLVATGYWRLMQWDDEPADPKQHAYDVMDDNVRITGETFLGMSIGCARCHNHKTDPILQKDYYSFMSFIHGLTPFSNNDSIRNLEAPGLPVAKRNNQRGKPLPATLTSEVEMQEIENKLATFLCTVREKFAKKGHDVGKNAGGIILDTSSKLPVVWDYTETQPEQSWAMPGYNPQTNGWKQGKGGFGRNGTPGATVNTQWASGDIWMRTYFQLTEIPESLNLVIHHDEDAEIYLNGKMVKLLRGYLRGYVTIPLPEDAISALQTGKNVLGIHVLQTSGGQYIDAGLNVGDIRLTKLMEAHSKEVCTPEEIREYETLQKALRSFAKGAVVNGAENLAQVAVENGPKPAQLHVHIRGNPHSPGDEVAPAFPVVFKSAAPEIRPAEKSSGRRRALAEWMTNPQNPRTARVLVNRLWQWHFGRGLNPTSNEFGKQGTGVSHPQLLDWLSGQLVAKEWSLKQMHRLIMTSQAYQQSAILTKDQHEKGMAADPGNTLWWRFEPRRLTSEELRDSLLVVAGNINLGYGGESFFAEMPDEVLATASQGKRAWGTSPVEQRTRRSVYMKSKRSMSNPLMTDFDQADTDNPCPVRFATTVPTQALNLLNSKFMNDQAGVLADRLKKEHAGDLRAQLKRGVELATQRPAKSAELDHLLKTHADFISHHKLDENAALDRVCLVILNLNEFLFLD